MLNCLIPSRFQSVAHLSQCAYCQSQSRQRQVVERLLNARAEHIGQISYTPSHDFMQKLAHRLRLERDATWDSAVLSLPRWPQFVITFGAMALLLIVLVTSLALKPATNEEEVFTPTTVESASLNGYWMGE